MNAQDVVYAYAGTYLLVASFTRVRRKKRTGESLWDWKEDESRGAGDGKKEREREREKENERGERLQGKTGTWREWREFIITSRGQQGSLRSDALFKSENPPRRVFKCCRFVIPLNTARCRRY